MTMTLRTGLLVLAMIQLASPARCADPTSEILQRLLSVAGFAGECGFGQPVSAGRSALGLQLCALESLGTKGSTSVVPALAILELQLAKRCQRGAGSRELWGTCLRALGTLRRRGVVGSTEVLAHRVNSCLRDATSIDPRTANVAIDALAILHEESAVAVLINVALSPRSPAPDAAVGALAAIGSTAAIEGLATVCAKAGRACTSAALALCARGDDRGVRCLVRQIKTTRSIVLKRAVISSFAHLKPLPREALQILLTASHDDLASVRADAIRALGLTADIVNLPTLRMALDDPDFAVRYRALEATVAIPGRESRSMLEQAASDHTDTATRAVAQRFIATPPLGPTPEQVRRVIDAGCGWLPKE